MDKIEGCHCHQATFIDPNGQLQTTLVPVVQELSRLGLKHLPNRFIQISPPYNSTHNLEPNSTQYDNFPVIDLAKLRAGFDPDGQCRTQELANLDLANLQVGFDSNSQSRTQELANLDPANLHPWFDSNSKSRNQKLANLDLANLQAEFDSNSQSRTQELAKLAKGAKEWGLFLIKNHGIEDWVLDGVKECVKGFFGLTFEEKKNSVGYYMSTDNMGYGRNYVKSEDQRLEWIDRITMMAAPKDATQGLHVWPLRPPNFRQAVEKYVDESRKVLDELLQALAESLSLDKNTFFQYFEPKQSEIKIRVNYYPPCPRPDQAIGINPHSDASALTLLIEFGATRGLQVFNYNTDRWITVPWPKDTLLVNAGDLMEIMSNGKIKSPWHRVITQMEEERFSMALFYNPPSDVEIEPVGEREMVYKKVNVGKYVKNYYDISPTDSKKAIMFAKVC